MSSTFYLPWEGGGGGEGSTRKEGYKTTKSSCTKNWRISSDRVIVLSLKSKFKKETVITLTFTNN